ncbi:hypothetical protein JNMOADIG_00137 [Aeromonas phage avDM5]|uniref:Uncharacterized protein n=1 Tax=Aeromonas phage vB_AehM_DM2 TaxID=2973716 RepID=A0AA94YNI0_9CAUD|nr:hypothetical protein JNMOADIG_00137 [Aeromonas phage avDM5]UYD60360.1 hypothetical protein NPHMPGLK_00025 [Aeromonas phage avDM2]UYD60804.1 hypothetical protein NHNEHLNL_00208 [Aeromonas phage avDM2]
MSIVKERFFNYKTFFIDAINRMCANTPPGCIQERGQQRSSFLRDNRTIHLNLGRMSGKTTGLIQLANELVNQGGSRIITMNPANKRHVRDMISYQYRDDIQISIRQELTDRCPKVKFLMVDESEYTLTSRHHHQEIYDWAGTHGVEFVIMT